MLLPCEIDVPLRGLIQTIAPAAATRNYQLCRKSIGTLERLAARFGSKALLKGEAGTLKSAMRNKISVVC